MLGERRKMTTYWRLVTVTSIFFKLSGAFVLPPGCGTRAKVTTTRRVKDKNDIDDFLSTIRNVGVAAAILAFNNGAAHAAVDTELLYPRDSINVEAMQSSSIELAVKEITTMEFSLPSSYDSISDSKAAANELTQVENIATGSKKKSVSKPPSAKIGLPSITAPKLTDEEKAAISAKKESDKKAAVEEKKAIAAEKDLEKAAERDAQAAEKASKNALLAKQRATETAQKAIEMENKKAAAKEAGAKSAAEVTKNQTPFEQVSKKSTANAINNADFVEMGLPSYDTSAGAGKAKSAFSF